MIRRLLSLLAVLALVAAACTKGGGPSPSPSATTGGPTVLPTTPVAAALPGSTVDFGTYVEVPLLSDATPYAGPSTPRSLEGVQIAPDVAVALEDPDVSSALERLGFVVVPSDLRLFHQAYDGAAYGGWPVFVTTDAAYHVWHLVFDKLLRSLEQEVLLPKLEELVSGLLAGAREQAGELSGSPLEASANRVEQLFQVAATLLGLDAGALAPEARAELSLIEAHAEVAESPILGSRIDYSLFTPRGHYTRNKDLTRFFLAMSVLGQSAFCLPGTFECSGVDPLRTGILAARVLTGGDGLPELWRSIYEPTAFLVGMADDYTPFEVAQAAEEEAAGGLSDPEAFSDDAAVTKVAGELAAARPVQIDPEKASVRLMGVRFVIDSYVLDQLIAPNVGTPDEPRLIPSPLDLAAAFGSEFAYDVQDEAGETAYENYDAKLREMRTAVADRPAQDWGGTVYDAWLHALEPMWLPHGEAFPDFMRTPEWTAKDHQSGFGSYAELKHDTILFAKQAVAEGGDLLPEEAPRNWVEPDPVAFGRLDAALRLMWQGLEDRGLLTREQARLLHDADGLFEFLGRIAVDELAGEPISDRDNERLRFIGRWLEGLYWRTADVVSGGLSAADQDAAIVADIARGGSDVVEVGTGRIDRIYVLVRDDEGVFQVAVGGVYSYYEFLQPASERLTDEAWRVMLDEGNAPGRPAWEAAFLSGG